MFFLPNVTTLTCFFSKFHKNEKSLQPSVQYCILWFLVFETMERAARVQYTVTVFSNTTVDTVEDVFSNVVPKPYLNSLMVMQ